MKYPRITIRVSQKQKDWLQKEADKNGIKLSAFIKWLLFNDIKWLLFNEEI